MESDVMKSLKLLNIWCELCWWRWKYQLLNWQRPWRTKTGLKVQWMPSISILVAGKLIPSLANCLDCPATFQWDGVLAALDIKVTCLTWICSYSTLLTCFFFPIFFVVVLSVSCSWQNAKNRGTNLLSFYVIFCSFVY